MQDFIVRLPLLVVTDMPEFIYVLMDQKESVLCYNLCEICTGNVQICVGVGKIIMFKMGLSPLCGLKLL